MTIQEAIDKAIEGGYPKERLENLSLHVQAHYFPHSPGLSGRPMSLRW